MVTHSRDDVVGEENERGFVDNSKSQQKPCFKIADTNIQLKKI